MKKLIPPFRRYQFSFIRRWDAPRGPKGGASGPVSCRGRSETHSTQALRHGILNFGTGSPEYRDGRDRRHAKGEGRCRTC